MSGPQISKRDNGFSLSCKESVWSSFNYFISLKDFKAFWFFFKTGEDAVFKSAAKSMHYKKETR